MKSLPATVALIAAVALAGCANTNIAFRSGNPPPLGSSYQSASVHAELNSNPYFSLLFLGMFAAGVERNYSDLQYGPDRRACRPTAAPPSANLRCK